MKTYFLLSFLLLMGVFVQAQNYDEIIKVVASDRAPQDYYGYSVAISGEYAIVGAPYEDQDAIADNAKSEAGSAYILKRNSNGTWVQKQKIVAPGRKANDHFGISVAMSGNYALVGANDQDYDATGMTEKTNAGAALPL